MRVRALAAAAFAAAAFTERGLGVAIVVGSSAAERDGPAQALDVLAGVL
jgi:hypothetical protein